MTDRLLVCRCEDVTARDVRRAVAQGHRDIESLKRFTGLGTGICQGVHCLALALRIAQEAAAPPTGAAPDADVPFTPRPPLEPVPLAWLAALPLGEPPQKAGVADDASGRHPSEPAPSSPGSGAPSSTGSPSHRSATSSTTAPKSKPTQGG